MRGALVAIMLFLLGSAAQASGVDRLYVIDCGWAHAADYSLWSPGVNVGVDAAPHASAIGRLHSIITNHGTRRCSACRSGSPARAGGSSKNVSVKPWPMSSRMYDDSGRCQFLMR